MKILNKLILLIIIIILILVGLIYLLKQSTNGTIVGKEDSPQINVDIEEIFEEENKIQLIETKAEYFNVKKCIEKYVQYSNELSDNQQKGTKLLSIIPDFVKQELGIEVSNASENIGLPSKIIRIDSIYKSLQTISKEEYEESTNICAYIVEGYLIEKNTYKKDELKLIILLDINNSTFLVIPQKYIEQKQIDLENSNNFIIYDKEIIENKQYNVFNYSTETAEDMSKEYFNIFKMNLNYDLEYIYNCLDAEYNQARFGNFNKFKEYIQNNEQSLKEIKFDEYLVNYEKEYIEYVCKDQNGNLYIFKETSPMNFTLKLDTYTITTEKYKSEYKKASVPQKVMMNIDKWVQMLNNRDYIAAYSLLDETFRNNNFGSEKKFEEYMKKQYPLYYKIEFLNFSSQSDIYIQDIKLTDITNSQKVEKELNIIMKLEEETDFTMSFNIE